MIDLRSTIIGRMKRLGLSQADLCRLTNIYPANLSQFLAGKRDMQVSSIETILDALGGKTITFTAGRRRPQR